MPGTDFDLATASPLAPDLLDKTRAISAGKLRAFAASISALMFEPRPEMRMATRLRATLRSEVESARVGDMRCAIDHRDLADPRHRLTDFREGRRHRVGFVTSRDHDHARAAVEGAKHFGFVNSAGMREPPEHGRHANFREIDSRN